MTWREFPPSFAAVLVSQLCFAGLAAAQIPAVGEPKPADDQSAPPADTKQTPADAESGQAKRPRKTSEEEIVVTGSRVRRKDLATPAPVTLISKDAIQASGRVSIGDFLQSLPEQGNAINTTFNNGGNGSTRVSLRGLGVARTLVLLNGRRFVPGGTGADASVDLNSVPTNAIERIEVLKDGASAVYGSDAIAGVINLITKKRMNGAEVLGYAGTSSRADGTTYEINGSAGTSGERGNLLFTVGYAAQKSVMSGDRPWSILPFRYETLRGVVTEGSPTGPTALITLAAAERGQVRPNPNNDPRIAAYNDLINQCTNTDRATCPSQYIYDDKLGQWRPFRGVALEQDGGDGYNFNPDNYLATPLTRISLFSLGDTKLGNNARGYFEASYVNRQSDQLLAAEPLGTGGEGIVVSGNSIYNPFGRDFRSVNRRLFEFGGRRFSQDIDTLRVVAGVDGTLPDEAGFLKGWFWDLSFNYGRTQGTSVKQGNIKLTGLRDALGPSLRDPGGVPRCVRDASQPATGGNVIAGCVPMDIFGPPGSIAPDQVANLTFTGTLRGTNEMTAVQFNTAGELFQFLADRPIGLAVGYEYRILSGANIPDPLTVAGETTGNKSDITKGHYYVNEGYGELSIPIVSNLPLAQSVEATVAGRVFNYSNFGTDGTYKFGGRWGLIRDFAVRGTYSTGFRAPSINDLFLGAADAFPRVQDPCRGSAAPASCGINANNGDTRVQINAPLLGNPQLKPEKAKIFTVGVVIEPRMIRNFTITADYYNVAIDETISRFGAPLIVRNCYFGDPATAQQYCDLILRDEGTRQITRILNKAQNVGSDKAAGVDIALSYAIPSDFGRFGFVFDGTWLQKYDRTLADGTLVHGKGTYDLGVYPTIKFNTGVRWSYQSFGAGVTARVVGSYKECGQAGSPAGNFVFSGGGLCYPLPSIDATNSRTVGVYSAWDLFASYMFPSPFGRTTITAGVINAFDRRPVRVYNGFTASSDASTYADGYMGRFFYGRVGHSF